jgi:flagellar basal-body rod modification protein FlgD
MTGVSLITKTQAANSAGTAATASQPASSGQTLNQNDFLKLLVAQMQYQDPMNPQSDTQMAAQMAQFTSLQQTSQMSSSLSMMQANNLVGSTVTVQVDPNNRTKVATGIVTGMTMASGSPQILVTDPTTTPPTTTPYNLNQVLSMTPIAPATSTTGK